MDRYLKCRKMTLNQVRGYSECINFLRFPLAILVVFVHGFGPEIDVSELHANGLNGLAVYDYIKLFFSVVISSSAVPIFFIISGYLLFKKVEVYNMSVYFSKLRKRWYSLVVPYFSWIVLFILWILMFKVGGILLHGKPWTGILDYLRENGYLHMFWDSSIWNERITWFGIKIHNSGPVLLPFWYMRDLMMMVAFSPIIYWFIKKISFLFIVLLLVIYTFDLSVSWISNTFSSASLFFSIGAYFALKKQDFTEVLWKWRYLICLTAIILMAYQTYSGSTRGDNISKMIYPWLVIFQSFAFILISSKLCEYSKLYELCIKLARTSFFIYALHPFILNYVITITTKMMPRGDTWYVMSFNYFISPLVCVGICIGIFCLMQKFLPGILKVMVGERKR